MNKKDNSILTILTDKKKIPIINYFFLMSLYTISCLLDLFNNSFDNAFRNTFSIYLIMFVEENNNYINKLSIFYLIIIKSIFNFIIYKSLMMCLFFLIHDIVLLNIKDKNNNIIKFCLILHSPFLILMLLNILIKSIPYIISNVTSGLLINKISFKIGSILNFLVLKLDKIKHFVSFYNLYINLIYSLSIVLYATFSNNLKKIQISNNIYYILIYLLILFFLTRNYLLLNNIISVLIIYLLSIFTLTGFINIRLEIQNYNSNKFMFIIYFYFLRTFATIEIMLIIFTFFGLLSSNKKISNIL